MFIFSPWGHFYQNFAHGCTRYVRTTPAPKNRSQSTSETKSSQQRQVVKYVPKKSNSRKDAVSLLASLLKLCSQITNSQMELIADAGVEKGYSCIREMIDDLFPGEINVDGDSVPVLIADVFLKLFYEGGKSRLNSSEIASERELEYKIREAMLREFLEITDTLQKHITAQMRNSLFDAILELPRGEWISYKAFFKKVREYYPEFTFRGSALSGSDSLFLLLSIRKTVELKSEGQDRFFRMLK